MDSMIEYRRRLSERDLAAAWPQWRIVRLLGTGSFGEVYEIHREEYGRISKSALKIIRQEKSVPMPGDVYTNISRGNTGDEFITSVLKEIDIMEQLKGAPNIVVIDDYTVVRSQDSSAVLIRMELLTNLGEFMTTRQISMNDILRIGIDTCNALEYCEHKNIIHRDVKESNIFYSEMGYFKLGDFGISRQLNDYLLNSGTLTSAGTVSKMAPEVFNGQKYDHRVDIYSLGIVLYSLLNYGRPPFYPPYPEPVSIAAAGSADMARISGTAIPPLPGVDKELNKIICKACNPSPNARYKNAVEFRTALENYSDRINNSGASFGDESPRTGNKKVLAGVLVASLAVIIGSVSIWLGTRSSGGNSNTDLVRNVSYEEEPSDDSGRNSDDASQSGEEGTAPADYNSDGTDETQETDDEHPDDTSDSEDTGASDDSGHDTYAGSSYSIKEQQDNWDSRNSEEAEVSEDGSIYLKTQKGKRAIEIDPLDWGSIEYSASDAVVFSNNSKVLWIQYYSDVSYSPGFGVRLEQAYYSENSDVIHIDSVSDVTTSNVGDYEVYWFTAKYRYINDDGSYGRCSVLYYAEIAVQEGILEFEDRKITEDEYAEFDEDEFFDDLSCWKEVE